MLRSKEYSTKQIILYVFVSILLSRAVMYFWHVYTMGTWSVSAFIDNINTWDAGWYGLIVDKGYTFIKDNGQAPWAFFPLYPMLVRFVQEIIPLNYEAIETLTSTTCFSLAMFVLYKYIVLTRQNEKVARIAVYFFCFGVYSFYASSGYTEALYMLLLICCYYFMKKQQYILMGICGAFLSMTRNIGVLFVFVILVWWIQKYFEDFSERSLKGFICATLSNHRLILGTCLVPLGLFSFMLFLKQRTGDGFAFFHVQIAWGRSVTFYQKFISPLVNGFPPGYLWTCACVSLALIMVLIFVHHRFDEALMSLLTFIISTSRNLNSIPRYMWGGYFWSSY